MKILSFSWQQWSFYFANQYWFKLTAFKSSKTSSRFTKEHSSTVSLIHIVAEIRLVHNLAKKVVKCVLHYIQAEYFNRWFLGLGMSTFWNLWRLISPKPKKICCLFFRQNFQNQLPLLSRCSDLRNMKSCMNFTIQ